jgi:hypothetical protein
MIRRSPPKAEAFTQQMWRYIFAALKFTGTCGRAVECTGFENRQTRKGLVSSNLTGSDYLKNGTNRRIYSNAHTKNGNAKTATLLRPSKPWDDLIGAIFSTPLIAVSAESLF